MAFLATIKAYFVLSGFLVGLLVGLTGVGGGALMTPLLILLFGFQPISAVGTDILFASATKTAGTVFNGFRGQIDWRIVGRLALGSVPAAIATIVVLHSLGFSNNAANAAISKILACVLVITSAALVFRKQLLHYYAKRIGILDQRRTRKYTILTGVILGIMVSSTSVGAGALGVTAVILLYPDLPAARLVASDIAHAVPLTLVAGLGHWLLGNADVTLLSMLLAGSLPGIFVGSMLSASIPDTGLRRLLAIVLLLVAVRLFM